MAFHFKSSACKEYKSTPENINKNEFYRNNGEKIRKKYPLMPRFAFKMPVIAHMRRSLILGGHIRRPCVVHLSTFSNDISEAIGPILSILHI